MNALARVAGAAALKDSKHMEETMETVSLEREYLILKNILQKHLLLSGKKSEEFLNQFISSLPVFFKDRLQLSVCES